MNKKLRLESRQNTLIIKRWADLIVLSVITALLFISLNPFIGTLTRQLYNLFPRSETFNIFSVSLIIIEFLSVIIIWYVIIRLGGFRLLSKEIFKSFKIRFLYPPTWCFAFLGGILYYWGRTIFWKTYTFEWFVIGSSIISFVPGIITACFLDKLFSHKKLVSMSIENIYNSHLLNNYRSILHDKPAFIRWINKETPINTSTEDIFGLSVFAKRISRMLQDNNLKTIAIVGSYGCGKSSIINMVEEDLRSQSSDINYFNKENIMFCNVRGWGLQRNAAIEHILQSVLVEMSTKVDCLGLSYIPTDYRHALSNTGYSWLRSIAILSNQAKEPLEILRKMDLVLTCIGMRVVIFLEDLDRNVMSSNYIEQITSLLDNLKDLDNISFVLAISQSSIKNNSLFRVCEHIEFIPALARNEVLDCIKYFRNICIDDYIESDIDCRRREMRDQHLGIKKTHREYQHSSLFGEVNSPVIVVSKLLNNPRMLKTTLRHSLQSWQSLHGEIDFDDLFVTRVIYTIAPEAFSFINQNIGLLRSFNTDSTSEFTRKRQGENREVLDKEWEKIQCDWNKIMLKHLIIYLFPGWNEDDFYQDNVPQGVLQSDPTDYWVRLNREEVAMDELRDQTILHAVQSWKENKSTIIYQNLNLSEAIFNIDGFARKIEHFGNLLDGGNIRELASEVFENIRNSKNSNFDVDSYLGFFELWRLSLDNPSKNHYEWILVEIEKALPISLRLANSLYYYWSKGSRTDIDITNIHISLRKRFVEAARKCYESDLNVFIKALDEVYIYSIYHLMIFFSQTKYGGSGFNASEWDWLVNTILESAKINSRIIIPQLVPLICDELNTGRGELTYSINEKRLQDLFGKKRDILDQILSNTIDTSIFNERERNYIEYVQSVLSNQMSTKHTTGDS
ncbi:MAG: hypothetical protein HPY65_15635 [Syntrophaceae bacterium]|nr:hypothetical protein [Syntrophaceae bacterium]